MNLHKLLKKTNIINYKKYINHNISLITDNSNSIIDNSIFVCIDGYHKDGHDFILDAVNKKVKTIFIQYDLCINNNFNNINIIKVKNTKKIFSLLIYYYKEKYFKNRILIGLTGTNGKTSSSTIIYNYLSRKNKKVILIGSNGIIYKNNNYSINNTTPNLKEITDIFDTINKLKYKYIIMEVSSISIKESRIFPLKFNIKIFTNLSLDHLDYHKSIIDYRYSKLLLFLMNSSKNEKILLNIDDPTSVFYSKFINDKKIKYYSLKNKEESNYYLEKIIKTKSKEYFSINNKLYKSNLTFDFNLYNILASYSVLDLLKINLNDFNDFLLSFTNIDGRLDFFYLKNRYFLIDFAHTPDGIKNVLSMLDKTKYTKIIQTALPHLPLNASRASFLISDGGIKFPPFFCINLLLKYNNIQN